MNPQLIANLIEIVLSHRLMSASGRYEICIYKGLLKVLSLPTPLVPDLSIMIISELQIVNGFSNKQWGAMTNSIIQYLERNELCLADLIP